MPEKESNLSISNQSSVSCTNKGFVMKFTGIAITYLICFLPGNSYIFACASDNQFVFCNEVVAKQLCPKKEYAQAVDNLPICCVDIFVYNPQSQCYYMVLRKQKPAQHEWWYPGGRLFKGESFFDCARRKCAEEVGLEVNPVKLLSVYSTIFPDSEWNCQTHTVNSVVLALHNSDADLVNRVDHNHEEGRWLSITISPENPYLNAIYQEAVVYLIKNNF